MTLKYFYDLLSQPSRALYILLKINNIRFESCPVALRQGEHLSDEFKEKNRFQKVPFIHDGNFVLAESVAIVRYLSREHGLPSSWYPTDSKEQALIDEYLEWQHHNTRAHCALYFQHVWLKPIMTGTSPDAKKTRHLESNINTCMEQLESLWLKDRNFLCSDKITVADVFAACEIEQPRMAGLDPLAGRPKLENWLKCVKEATNPYYEEAHTILNKIVNKTKKNSKL